MNFPVSLGYIPSCCMLRLLIIPISFWLLLMIPAASLWEMPLLLASDLLSCETELFDEIPGSIAEWRAS